MKKKTMVLMMIIKSCAQTLAGIVSLAFTKRSASLDTGVSHFKVYFQD